jgi:hypothetical protein
MPPPQVPAKALLQISLSLPSSSRPTSIPTVQGQNIPDVGGREAEADGKIGGALTRLEPVRDLLRTRPALCPGDALGSRCHLGLRTSVCRRRYRAGFVRATDDGGGLGKQESQRMSLCHRKNVRILLANSTE